MYPIPKSRESTDYSALFQEMGINDTPTMLLPQPSLEDTENVVAFIHRAYPADSRGQITNDSIMSDPVIARGIETFKRVPKEFTYMQMECDYRHCWNPLVTIARLITATYSTYEATAQYELTGESMFKTAKRSLHASAKISLP